MSSLTLDSKKFNYSALGALLVILGVVVKNTIDQSKLTNKTGKLMGMVLFLIGWGLTAFSIALNEEGVLTLSTKSIVVGLATGLIILAVLFMKNVFGVIDMDKKKRFGMLFALGWLALGFSVGMGANPLSINKKSMIGLSGAVLVISSMLKILPTQREKCIVDGPGMPMFVMGWLGIVFGNSLL